MLKRTCSPTDQQSFFLFGARGSGKSTLLRSLPFLSDSLYIDLLKPSQEEQYALRPELLAERVLALNEKQWVVIDEVQKLPKLLNVVHSLIEERATKFALTGSSSRKLRRGAANLLAGRAVIYSLFPLTQAEIGAGFDLDTALAWGTLPRIHHIKSDSERARFLRAYVQGYIKEEILVEQLVKNLDPFRLFLPIAAQMDTQIVNYSNIARDTGVDHKTVSNYYQILIDTYLGFFLEPFSRSVRKVQVQSPKFYFFDTGVRRALQRKLNLPLETRTTEYGNSFEAWFVNECFRQNAYGEHDFELSYLRTKDDVEIDLIVQKPNGEEILVEIKSSDQIDERHVASLIRLSKDFPKARKICASQVSVRQQIQSVSVLPWREALSEIFS